MQKTARERRYPPDFGHWHGGPTPHICKIGNSLDVSEQAAAALDKIRKQHQEDDSNASVRRTERPPDGR